MTFPLAGQIIRASDIKRPMVIRKAAGEDVTNSATMQNDNDFVVVLPIGLWHIDLFLHITNAGPELTSDFKTQWTFSGTSASSKSIHGAEVATSNITATLVRLSGHALATAVNYGVDDALTSIVHEDLELEVTVAGTLQLQWAQAAAVVGVTTTVSAASRMYITEMEQWQ